MCTYESIITRLATHKVLFVGVKTIILYGYVYLCLMFIFFPSLMAQLTMIIVQQCIMYIYVSYNR